MKFVDLRARIERMERQLKEFDRECSGFTFHEADKNPRGGPLGFEWERGTKKALAEAKQQLAEFEAEDAAIEAEILGILPEGLGGAWEAPGKESEIIRYSEREVSQACLRRTPHGWFGREAADSPQPSKTSPYGDKIYEISRAEAEASLEFARNDLYDAKRRVESLEHVLGARSAVIDTLLAAFVKDAATVRAEGQLDNGQLVEWATGWWAGISPEKAS